MFQKCPCGRGLNAAQNGADTKAVPDIRNGDFYMLDICNSQGLGSLVEEKGKDRVKSASEASTAVV